jgi:hypothetical protein
MIPRLEDLRRQEEAPATPAEPPIVPR